MRHVIVTVGVVLLSVMAYQFEADGRYDLLALTFGLSLINGALYGLSGRKKN